MRNRQGSFWRAFVRQRPGISPPTHVSPLPSAPTPLPAPQRWRAEARMTCGEEVPVREQERSQPSRPRLRHAPRPRPRLRTPAQRQSVPPRSALPQPCENATDIFASGKFRIEIDSSDMVTWELEAEK